jgi:hypothetical protein
MINPELLHELAENVENRIAKVVLNGTYEITSFRVKQVTESIVALNYFVPVADVSLITLIELKDSAGNMITSNAVNVPITADLLMMQNIEIKEGA